MAVINKNGLWIRDRVNEKIIIVNSSKIDGNYLINSFITEFDENYNVIRNIFSEKIDIKNNRWIVLNPEIYIENKAQKKNEIYIYSNFNLKRISSLFSNLSSLSFLDLVELKRNYDQLNYSTIDIDIQIHRIVSYPAYLLLMTILSSIIMLNSKRYKSSTLKISIGLFFCVIIYYLNNLFNVLGATEKINYLMSIWLPLLILSLVITLMIFKINEK